MLRSCFDRIRLSALFLFMAAIVATAFYDDYERSPQVRQESFSYLMP